jgi:hypothetical protein
LQLWAMANYCRAGIKSLRGTGGLRQINTGRKVPLQVNFFG